MELDKVVARHKPALRHTQSYIVNESYCAADCPACAVRRFWEAVKQSIELVEPGYDYFPSKTGAGFQGQPTSYVLLPLVTYKAIEDALDVQR